MIGAEGVMGRVVRIWIGVLLIVGVILMLRDVRLEIQISVLSGTGIESLVLKTWWYGVAALV